MELCSFKRNNFILYKLIPCLIITMFSIMCLYGSKVYASVDVDNLQNTTFHSSTWDLDYTVVLPNDLNNYSYFTLFTRNDDNSYRSLYLLLSNSPIVATNTYLTDYQSNQISFTNIEKYYNCVHNSYNKLYNSSIFDFTQSSTNGYNVTTSNVQNNISFTYFKSSTATNVSDFFSYSNFDILDEYGNLVFQAPSQTQTIVASQVGEVEMNKTLQEILGILPVVVVVLVGLIAIRKGIIFLMARMKKA